MEDFDFDDKEVDSSTIFKQSASELTSVTNLESTLSKFGFKKDDRIDRRDMVIMYSTVEKEMEKEISNLAHDSAYSSAKEMRNRLSMLRREFDDLQTSGVKILTNDQRKYFETASNEMKYEISTRHQQEEAELLEYCERAREDLKRTHDIQSENLEKQIQRIPRPPMKYGRRLIELFKAETGYENHEIEKMAFILSENI